MTHGGRESTRAARSVHSLLMLLLVSVVGGGLLAGLAIPAVVAASAVTNLAATSFRAFGRQLTITPQFQRSRILLADGSVLATFYDQNRVYAPLSDIAPVMQHAQIAVEDRRFYSEGAIDVTGTLRALVSNLTGGRTQGGSTLTQQYVKLVRLQQALAAGDSDQVKAVTAGTIARKVMELEYAVGLVQTLTKQQVLEGYLNIAYYGDGAYGVQVAAHHFFGTDAAHLSLGQAALLAGLVQNPVGYNPVNHPADALNRRNVVLDAMVSNGFATAAQAAEAKKEKFDASKVVRDTNGCQSSRYPFLCDYVVKTVTSDAMPGLGATSAARMTTLRRGGLTIKTLVDPVAQDTAQQALASRIDPRDPVVGTVVEVEPKTGRLIAMAQSRPVMGPDAAAGQTYYNYAVGSAMGGTPGFLGGSTFKVFTLATALANGWTPDSTLDVPNTLDIQGQQFTNCSGTFTFKAPHTIANSSPSEQGTFTLTDATAESVNTYFTELEQQLGICPVVRMAQAAGLQRGDGKDLINDPPHYDWIPSFTLGTVNATPLSMTTVYGTFANRGVRCTPIVLAEVTKADGSTLNVPDAGCTQAVDPNVADGVSSVLTNVLTSGTGRSAYIPGYDIAGKTGTVTGATTVWFDGYTPDLACTVMIGVDPTADYWRRTGKTPSLAHLRLPHSGTYINGYGGSDSAPIWRTVMQSELRRVPRTAFIPYNG